MYRDVERLRSDADRAANARYDARFEVELITAGERVIDSVQDTLRSIIRNEHRLAALERAGFNPAQPRIPAGNPDGGQWTSGDSAGAGTTHAIPAAAKQRSYSVVLESEERRGGHTIRDHVGKSDEYLINEVKRNVVRGMIYDEFEVAEGSFTDVRTANDYVNRVLEASQGVVDGVADGAVPEAVLQMRFGFPTGKEAYHSDEDEAPYIRTTYEVRVVVRPDNSTRGYFVLTAFPVNRR